MKKYLLLSFCFLSFTFLFAQDARYHFGNVPVSQLEMTTYDKDSSAAAVILHDYGDIKVMDISSKYIQIFSRCRRIKILTKGGLEYGDLQIPYITYDNQERIANLRVIITLPNGEKQEFKNKDFFTEKRSKYFSVKKIALPQLEVGAVIDYYYKIESDIITELKEWTFQNELPIQLSELTIDFDERISYMYIFQGFEGMKKTTEGENIILKDSITSALLEPEKFTITNVPTLKTEPFITTLDDYVLKMRFQCTRYLTGYGESKEVLSDWETVNEKLLNSHSFGYQYTRKMNYGRMLREATSVIEEKLSSLEKAKSLYDFVNKNISDNQNSGIYVEESLNKMFEKKSASKSEMNLMLIALLHEAEIEAYPLLISTRNHGMPIPEHPIVDQFNRALVCVVIDKKIHLVECGNKLRPFGELSRSSMNGKGYLLKEGGEEWINIVPKKSKKIFLSDLTLDGNRKMKGRISANYTKSAAAKNRWDWINNEEEKSWVRQLETSILDFELDSVTIENKTKITKPFKIHFDGDFSGAAQEVGDFMYINPFIFCDFLENPFKSEKRQYPVDFPYPFSNQFIINLQYDTEIYEIEELPKYIKLTLPNKAVTVRYAAQEKSPGSIQVTYALSVNQPYFLVNTYSGLRSLFDITAEKLGEQIVLKKR